LQLKERLAADDPTGSTAVSGFGLGLPPLEPGAEASPLRDDVALAEAHCLLDICPVQEPLKTGDGAGAGAREAAAEPPPAEDTEPPDSALLAWLKGIRLEAYHGAIIEHGFEELDDLRSIPVARVEELTGLVGMKLGHAVRFRKAVKDLGDVAG